MSGDLPEPAVPQDVYTEDYFRHDCMGATAWEASGGVGIDPLYVGYAQQAGVTDGTVLVDLGCGRGEMLVAAVQAGASRAVGVEYADAAVELAKRTLATNGVEDRAELVHGDARSVPVGDGEADVVTMLDVVEHLTPQELDRALREALRILRPGGRILIHTMPNRSIYEITYRLQRLARPSRVRTWPKDPRKPLEVAMHVNEMTVTSLRRALSRAGFPAPQVTLGDWMYTDFVPDQAARRLYHRLAARRLTARLGKGDLWARAEKPAA